MSLLFGILLFAITGGIMAAYIIGCMLLLGRVEPHMMNKKAG